MHLLAAQPGDIADGAQAVDLGQTPGEIVVLSAADSEIACLAAAQRGSLPPMPRRPSLRLASLLRLGHHYSVDLYVESVAGAGAARSSRGCSAGCGYWSYGVERLGELARARGIALALLPGDDQPDAELARALDPAGRPRRIACGAISSKAAPAMPSSSCAMPRA